LRCHRAAGSSHQVSASGNLLLDLPAKLLAVRVSEVAPKELDRVFVGKIDALVAIERFEPGSPVGHFHQIEQYEQILQPNLDGILLPAKCSVNRMSSQTA
jgi:hypothetical protein